MKKILILIVLLLLLPSVKAEEEINPREIGKIETKIEFSSIIKSTGKLNKLNHSVYIIPENYQELEIDAKGDFTYSIKRDEHGNKKLEIVWIDFESQNYTVKMKIENSAKFNGPKKSSFPEDTPSKTFKYLAESKYVIIDDDIREKASQITQGCGTGFEAVKKISSWIYSNLNYDIKYSKTVLPSDKVYENKKGTCDEFTNLFLAMCRSVGIPARYVAGITYSKEGWGYHAWAEVYLDDRWVPVDPTWNEIGWIDGTHIEFGKFIDGEDVKVTASYISEDDEEVEIMQPEPKVKIISRKQTEKIFDTEFESYPEKIGIGESSVLVIKTKTESDGCLATSLKINPRIDESKEPIISISGEKTISVCPDETETSHFVIKADDSLDKKYVYYKLADIYTFLGEKKTIDLEIDPAKDDYSKIDLILESQTVEAGEDIEFSVSSESDYRVYSNLPFIGNKIITSKKGSFYIIAVSETGQVIKKDIEVKEDLKFKIKNIKKPSLVSCGEKFNVSFTIENIKENNFEIETKQSSELRYIPKKYISSDEENIEIFLETKLSDECTGKEQFLNIMINEQRVFEKIETEKEKNVFEEIIKKINYIINLILESFKNQGK